MILRLERRDVSAADTSYKLISAGHNDAESFVVRADGSVYMGGDLTVDGSTDLNTGWTVATDYYEITSDSDYDVIIQKNLQVDSAITAESIHVNGKITADNLAWEIDDDVDSLIVTIGSKIVRIGEKSYFDADPDPNIAPLLSVYGTIAATDLYIFPPGDDGWWSDFVFDKDYYLMPINDLEKKIKENGHLPGIPSANEVSEKGISVAEMQAKLLQKIEELTLYVIELKKEINHLKNK